MHEYYEYVIKFTDSAPVIVDALSRRDAINKALSSTSFPLYKSYKSRAEQRKSIISCRRRKPSYWA